MSFQIPDDLIDVVNNTTAAQLTARISSLREIGYTVSIRSLDEPGDLLHVRERETDILVQISFSVSRNYYAYCVIFDKNDLIKSNE